MEQNKYRLHSNSHASQCFVEATPFCICASRILFRCSSSSGRMIKHAAIRGWLTRRHEDIKALYGDTPFWSGGELLRYVCTG